MKIKPIKYGFPSIHKHLQNLVFGKAKAPGFDDRKEVNINNMDLFTIVESRGFGKAEIPSFEGVCVYNAESTRHLMAAFTKQGAAYRAGETGAGLPCFEIACENSKFFIDYIVRYNNFNPDAGAKLIQYLRKI